MLATPKRFSWITDLLIISLGLGLFFTLWIGTYPLFTPDEGRYSEVAREMIATGDYITPHLNEVVFLDKPILYYWLQASAIKLFGLNEWALRFWPAILGIWGALHVYIAGRTLFNRRAGLLSALMLATSPLYFCASHYANLDLEVAVFISSALLFFVMGVELSHDRKKSFLCLMLGYLFSSFAFLTKGLIGIVFPAIILGLWFLFLYRKRLLAKMRLITGLIIFLMISAPWYIWVQKINPQFFQYFFVTQQFSRFLTYADFNNQTFIWFYFPVVALGFVPWSFFLLQAIGYHLKKVYLDRQQYRIELFFLLWAIVIFVFFSIPKSKTLGYILPIFPALALIVGHYFSNVWDKLSTRGTLIGLVVFNVMCFLMSLFCLWVSHTVPPDIVRYLMITSMILITSSVIVYYFLRQKQYHKAIYCVFITAMSFLLTFVASASAFNHKSIKPLAIELKSHLKPEDEVATYQKYFQDLPVYIERRITIISDWRSQYIPYRDNWQRELWFGMPYKDTSDWLIGEPTFWKRWRGQKHMYAFMYTDYFPYFKKKARKRVYILGVANDMILVTNQIPF